MQISVPSMQDLLSAGVHFGHKVSRAHPKMKQFIFGARDGVDIIDLAKSEEKLKEAVNAAYEVGKAGQVLLILGTKKQAREIIEKLAKVVDTPYLTMRWVPGLMTNFDEVKKNLKKLVGLREEQQKGELTRYTKKEQLLISRKLNKFEAELGGIAKLEKVPEAMFIVDAVSESTAVREALKMNIKILGLCDTNADPNWFDYPIPANDDGIKSINIICEAVINAYGQGKKDFDVRNEEIRIQAEKDAAKEKEELAGAVAEEAAALEEIIEKKALAESERKVS